MRQFTYRRNVGFIGSAVVVTQQSVELQRVELEAGVVYVLHVLHGVLVHGEEGRCLERQRVSHLIRTVVFKPFRTSTTFSQTRISPSSHYTNVPSKTEHSLCIRVLDGQIYIKIVYIRKYE